MTASLNTALFLVFCQLQSASAADPQLQPITAQRGGKVTMSCEAPNNVNISAVQWTRSDRKRHVYLKIGSHLNTADQDPSYVNRVQLMDDEMKNGELSLILNNVSSSDEGTYKCLYVEKRGGRRKRADQRKLSSIIQLKVTAGDSGSGKDTDGTEGGHLGVFPTVTLIAALVAVVGQVGVMVFNILKGRSEKKPVLPVHDPEVLQQLQENENSQKNITHNISNIHV